MKIEVIEKTPVTSIPDVGELWKHPTGSRIFMRIGDEAGHRVHPNVPSKDYFYSVTLEGAEIVYTGRTSIPLIIRLKLIEPVKAEMIS